MNNDKCVIIFETSLHVTCPHGKKKKNLKSQKHKEIQRVLREGGHCTAKWKNRKGWVKYACKFLKSHKLLKDFKQYFFS